MNDGWGGKVGQLIMPVLIYELVCLAVDFIASLVWIFFHFNEIITLDIETMQDALMEQVMQFAMDYTLIIQTAGAVITIFIMLRMMRNDAPKQRFVYDRSGIGLRDYLYCIPVGLFMSLAGNYLMNITKWADISDGFDANSTMIMNASFAVQMLAVSIAIPICEELIFRGLIYKRMREFMPMTRAIFICSVAFAIFHGNIVQAMYGFITGIVLCYAAEKYGTVAAPVLVHVSANLMSVLLILVEAQVKSPWEMMLIGLIGVIITGILIWRIDSRVNAKRIDLYKKVAEETM